MSYSEALKSNNTDELRAHLADRLEYIAYSMKRDSRKWGAMEYLNFTVMDLITGLFHGIYPDADDKTRLSFLNNLREIVHGLENFLNDKAR